VMTVRLQGVGAPPGQVIVFLAPAGLDLAGDPGMPSTRVEFLFSQVPPGEYWLLAASVSEPGAAPEFAAERVTVLDRDLPDIVVTTGKAVTITGRVEVEEGGSPPPNLQVLATPWDYELPALPGQPAEGAAVNVRADGTFTLSNVFGPRVLQLAHVPAGWAMDHVWLGDVGIIALPMELPSSAHPTIFVTRRLGSVDGEVQDNQGHPFASARVIIFGQDERRWGFRSRLIKSGLCGPDGRFVVDDLLPGEYLVAAMEYLEEGSWMNPDVLAALRSSAVAMRVSAGSPLSVTLKLR